MSPEFEVATQHQLKKSLVPAMQQWT
jgi:hypothetical protein